MLSVGKPTVRSGWNGKANHCDGWHDFGKAGRVYAAGDSRFRTLMRRWMSKARRRHDKAVCRSALTEK